MQYSAVGKKSVSILIELAQEQQNIHRYLWLKYHIIIVFIHNISWFVIIRVINSNIQIKYQFLTSLGDLLL